MHKGASWQAKRDTAKQPGSSDDWQLIAAAGEPGASFSIRGTHVPTEKYKRLDVVTLDYGWFVAKYDDPGPIPGPGWQAGPVGRRGEKGIPGERELEAILAKRRRIGSAPKSRASISSPS